MIKKAHAGFSRSFGVLRKFPDDHIENVPGVKLAEVAWKINARKPDHPNIAARKSFDIHPDLIRF